MHHNLCNVLANISHVAMESVGAVEDTCIHDIAYSNARLQPRPCFCLERCGIEGRGCLTAYHKDALYAAVLENTPAVGFVEETENEFENGNEEHGAG